MKTIQISATVFALILFAWLAGYVGFLASAFNPQPQSPRQQTDAIVVLTGGNHRIHTGLELFANGMADHLFVSGVNPDVTRWTIMSMWDGEPALPECCIDLGTSATTTLENALEVRAWMNNSGFQSMRLVSSSYHMARALMEMQAALPKAKIIVHPVTIPDYKPDQPRFWTLTFSEYNKTLYRRPLIMWERLL